MKLITLIIVFLVTGCSTVELVEPTIINDETNSFVEFTYKKAKSVNLIPLNSKSIIDGSKEIRIWVGFGIVSPEDLLIINIDKKGNVSGRKVLIYNRDPESWEGEEEALNEFLEDMYLRCDVIGIYNHIESCGIKQNEIYDWSKIYNKLEKLNVWTLPDESSLPKPDILVLDGFAIVVELREGNSYRAYHYGNPGFRKVTEAAQASEIMSFVLGL